MWDAAWVSPLAAASDLALLSEEWRQSSNGRSGIYLRKGHTVKVLICAAFLTNPGLSAIGCSYDCA